MLFGPPNAGKTSLVRATYLDLEFTEMVKLKPTKGISRDNFLFDGAINLNIWDTGGAERYIERYFSEAQRELVFSEVSIAIFVVDAFDYNTINSPKQMFDEFILNIFTFSTYIDKIYVLLNKIDLRYSQENRIIELLSSGLSIDVLKRVEFTSVSIRDGSAQYRFTEIIKIQVKNRATCIIRDFYNYCVLCSSTLHNTRNPRKYKNCDVFELRFCCSCYKKYENKTIDEFPKSLIDVINQKVKDHIEFKKKTYKTALVGSR